MSSLNQHQIIGRVGKDVEVRHLENGAIVANFSVATSESYKDRQTGERKEDTCWHNVVLWRGLAEIAEKYVKKGDLIYISGKSVTRSWEKDGITRYTTEIVGKDMKMLGSKSQGGNKAPQPNQADEPQWTSQPSSNEANGGQVDDSDDLPF